MTREEVLQNASISCETLRRWVNAGLVPTPQRGNKGRAGGKWSEYPPETKWEIAAAAHLLKAHSMKQVAEVRAAARGFIAEICEGELSDILAEFEKWQKGNVEIYPEPEVNEPADKCREVFLDASDSPLYENDLNVDSMIFSWIMARYKAEYGIPFDIPAQVQIEYRASWEIAQGAEGYGDDTRTVEQGWGGKMHTVFVDWYIKKVETHSRILEDEIVLRDVQTDIRLILKPFKKRKS